MNLKLEPITLNEDKNNERYVSDDCQMLLTMWSDFYPVIGFNFPWVGYFILENDEVIGSCAFTGKPINNRVEVSYWTFKENERKGIASWACSELVRIAKATQPNVTITAKTAPEKNASTKILEKNGFIFTGIVQDDEIGDAWEWTLNNI